MARKLDPAAVLAEQMLGVLEAARGQGPEAYPVPLERLRQRADPEASPELALKALSKRPLADRAAAAPKKSPAALLVLREDLGLLADSPRLLELLLETACTLQKPTVPLSTLKTRLDMPLKQPFEEAVERRVHENRLPPTMQARRVGKRLELYLARLPPLPPPPKPEVELAELLVRTLEQQRARGTGYPLSLRRLVEATAPAANAKLVSQALATPAFTTRVRMGLKSPKTRPNFDSPAALLEDQARLASSPPLLEAALRAARKKTQHAAAPSVLAGKVAAELKAAFAEHLGRLMEAERMPPGFGWVALGRTKQVFLVEDAHLGAGTAPPPAATLDFGRVFEEAFQRLDRSAGGHNFVNLTALRRELSADRETFDRELHKLRLAGRYTLSAAEGRHGLKPEEREAGILEDGTLLLFVSRRMG